MKQITLLFLSMLFLFSCSKKDDDVVVTPETPVPSGPKLIIKLQVDPDQVRLNNFGNPVEVAEGNAAQNPIFNSISAHYLEFAPTAFTQLGQGEVLYQAPETTAGGDNAIDFDQSNIINSGDVFLEIPIEDITVGSYEWVRLSLSYQNYDVTFYYFGIPYTGTLASFVGFNTYISNYTIKNEEVAVNANRLQGYWGFESITGTVTGQAPVITVPNPLSATSPIPPGSCIVTGDFETPFQITGNETEDVVVTLSLSINNSFEWTDTNGDGNWDVDSGTENVVDMGLRGLIPFQE